MTIRDRISLLIEDAKFFASEHKGTALVFVTSIIANATVLAMRVLS